MMCAVAVLVMQKTKGEILLNSNPVVLSRWSG
jgi:hypothetical protein